jgi:hypothetical protein
MLNYTKGTSKKKRELRRKRSSTRRKNPMKGIRLYQCSRYIINNIIVRKLMNKNVRRCTLKSIRRD